MRLAALRRTYAWYVLTCVLTLALGVIGAEFSPVIVNPFQFVPSFATVARVQNNNAGTSATSASFGSTTAANNLLTLVISCQNNSSVTNSVSTGPTGWTAGPTKNASNGTVRAFVAVYYKIAAGSDANPTYTISGANTTRTILEEWSGIDPSSPVDITFTGAATSSGSFHIGANTTTNDADWIFCAIGARPNLTITWSGGQATDTTNTASPLTCATSTQTTSVAGSYDPQASFTTGNAVAGVGIAFKRAAA